MTQQYFFIYDYILSSGARKGVKGNPVKIGDGPAAVTGDEHRRMPLGRIKAGEGAVSRVIRESEDLPEQLMAIWFPVKPAAM